MKKRLLLATLLMTFLFSITAFAGTWIQDGVNWRYTKDHGTSAVSEWITDNGKSYYFDANGNMLHDTITPDGYMVGPDGAWIEPKVTNTVTKSTSAVKKTGTLVGSVESDKYHYPDCRWAKEIHKENEIWFDKAEEAESKGYKPCKVCH